MEGAIMSEEQSRTEEFRLDPQEIAGKVEDVVRKGKTEVQEFRVSGDQLVSKIKDVIRAGNVRRIIIKNGDGDSLIEIPLTLGVAGAVIMPVWAAIGALAALALDCTIVVEKVVE
jgi:hypothetical protein